LHTETSAEAVSTSADAIDGDGTTSAPWLNDLPPLTMSDGAPQADDPIQGELINARLARLVREEGKRHAPAAPGDLCKRGFGRSMRRRRSRT
jgi:hypothetical protein